MQISCKQQTRCAKKKDEKTGQSGTFMSKIPLHVVCVRVCTILLTTFVMLYGVVYHVSWFYDMQGKKYSYTTL